MTSSLQADWPWIVQLFEKSLKKNQFFSFGTVNPDGTAHVTPIASLVFNEDCSGFYSEAFPGQMAANLKADQRVCIMAVNMGFGYWFKGLRTGRFNQWPGLRLYGKVSGGSRRAEPGEIDRWRFRVRRYKRFKGYHLLWEKINTVRDIVFDRFDPVRLGPMTRHLNPNGAKVGGL